MQLPNFVQSAETFKALKTLTFVVWACYPNTKVILHNATVTKSMQIPIEIRFAVIRLEGTVQDIKSHISLFQINLKLSSHLLHVY